MSKLYRVGIIMTSLGLMGGAIKAVSFNKQIVVKATMPSNANLILARGGFNGNDGSDHIELLDAEGKLKYDIERTVEITTSNTMRADVKITSRNGTYNTCRLKHENQNAYIEYTLTLKVHGFQPVEDCRNHNSIAVDFQKDIPIAFTFVAKQEDINTAPTGTYNDTMTIVLSAIP